MTRRRDQLLKGAWGRPVARAAGLAALCLLLIAHPLSSARADEVATTRSVTLDWDVIEDASSYQIEISLQTGAIAGVFKLKEAVWTGPLAPGEYRLRLRSYDARGVPGPWSKPQNFSVRSLPPVLVAPADGLQIESGSAEDHKVAFEFKAAVGAVKYKVEVFDGEKQLKSEMTEQTKIELQLPVAKSYQWYVTSIMNDGKPGVAPKDKRKFAVIGKQLAPAKPNQPEHKYVSELSWERSEHAEGYEIQLQRVENKKWKTVDKRALNGTSMPFPLDYAGGRYRLNVRAVANLRKPSAVSKVEFDVFQGDRNPASVDKFLLRDSIEQVKNWQFMASYLVTMMGYKGTSPEANSSAQYNALGGTGRLGVAYIPPGSQFGGQLVADMSGFIIGGQNFRYVSAEASGLYRKYIGSTQLRFSGGGFMREMPETVGITADSYRMEKIVSAGPRIGMDVWQPINYRLGVQVNASGYMNAMAISTPNGRGLDPSLSYQFGVMGSLRLRPTWIGFAGYAYRIDRGGYEAAPKDTDHPNSVATGSQKNTVEISGHYLNLLLEIGF